MNKITSFLILGFMMAFTSFLSAQDASLTLTTTTTSAAKDDIVTYELKATGFVNIVGAQWLLNWDANQLEFVEVSAFGLPGVSNNSFTIAPGEMRFQWDSFSANGIPETIADGTVVYQMKMKVKGNGTSASIVFGSVPIGTEVIDNNTNLLNTTTTGSTITVTGGGGSTGDGDVEFNISSNSAKSGEQVCVDVKVNNWKDIVGAQYAMKWDPAVLKFDQISNINLPNLSLTNFGSNPVDLDAGVLRFQWDAENPGVEGVTLPDGTSIYTVCFIATGAAPSSTTINIEDIPSSVQIEITELGNTPKDYMVTSGTVNITEGDGIQVISVRASNETAENGQTVCVKVTVDDFENIFGLQYTMNWDVNVLKFKEVKSFGLSNMSINDFVTNVPGEMGLLWQDPNGVTVDDGTLIYELCFDVVGTSGNSSDVSFGNSPFAIEATGADLSNPTVRTFDGSAQVIGDGGFVLTIGDATGDKGETVCVPVSVSGFTDILGLNWSINWDPDVIKFVRTQNFGLNRLNAGRIVNTAPGVARVLWEDDTAQGITIADATVLHEICFEIVGDAGSSSEVQITGTPLVIEVTQKGDTPGNNPIIDVARIDGTITSTSTAILTIDVPATQITNVNCFDDATGAIDLVVSGGVAPLTYAWINNATTEDIAGLIAGTYSVTVSDADGSTASESFMVTQPTADITIAVANITNESSINANDGAIDINVSGGTGAYTFAWSNSATTEDINGLDGGSYTVTVTDANGCSKISDPINVGSNVPALVINSGASVVTNINCFGAATGAIDVVVSGGVAPLTFAWSNSATTEDISGLAAGDYTITVTDAADQSQSFTFGVSQPNAALSISGAAIGENVVCVGTPSGSIDLTVAGGTGAYTYAWSNGASTEDLSNLMEGDYSLTITDANNCSITGGPYTVVKNTAANPIVISNPIIAANSSCSGTASGAINLTVTGGAPAYTYAWSNGSIAANLSGLSEGDYSVTITDTNGCTTSGGPYTVGVDNGGSSITIELTNVTEPACNSEATGIIDITVVGGAQPYTFAWANNGTPVNALEDLSGIFAGTYDVTVTDAGGCSATRQVVVNEPLPITVQTNNVTNESTSGANDGAIDVTVSGGTEPYTFTWSNGANTEDLSNIAGGMYNLIVRDANGCTFNSENILVNIDILPSLQINGDVNDPCFGENSGSIKLSVSGGMSPYTYNWSNNAGNVSDLNNLPAGSYAVTVQDQVGQSAIRVFNLIAPAAGITITNDIVTNESGLKNDGAINLTVAGGKAPYSYVWSNGATTEDLTGLAAGFYRVTITDASGCILVSNDFEVEFTAFPILIRNTDVTPPTCPDAADGKIEITIAGGAPGFTFTWSNGVVDIYGEENPKATLSNLSAGTYGYTITDASGQMFDNPVEVTAPDAIAIPTREVTDPSGLAGGNGSVDITVTGGTIPYSYAWSNGSTSEDISGLATGNYKVTITDSKGCLFVSQEFILGTGPLSIAVDGIVDETCAGTSTGAINVTVFGGNAPYTYQWSNDATTEDVKNIPAGTYALTITDGGGATTTLGGLVVDATFNLSAAGLVTSVFNGGFNVSGKGRTDGSARVTVTGGTPPYNYTWSMGNPIGDGSQATGLPEGTHSVTVVDANGCTQNVEVILTAPQALSASMEVLSNISCAGECTGRAQAQAVGGVAPYNYQWDAEDNFNDLAMNLCAGTYTVTITDANNIQYIGSFDFTEPAPLSLETSATAPTGNNSPDGSVSVAVTGGTAPFNYIWNDPDGCTTSDCNGIAATRDSLFVIVTDANNCMQIASVGVPTPPNDCFMGRPVITPNEDGLNDNFIITCVENVDNTLKIFNRWGQLVYEMENYDNSWNGTNQRGLALPEGPYYYVLEVEGEAKPVKGAISLLKEL